MFAHSGAIGLPRDDTCPESAGFVHLKRSNHLVQNKTISECRPKALCASEQMVLSFSEIRPNSAGVFPKQRNADMIRYCFPKQNVTESANRRRGFWTPFPKKRQKIKEERFGRAKRGNAKSEANAALFLGAAAFSNRLRYPPPAKRNCNATDRGRLPCSDLLPSCDAGRLRSVKVVSSWKSPAATLASTCGDFSAKCRAAHKACCHRTHLSHTALVRHANTPAVGTCRKASGTAVHMMSVVCGAANVPALCSVLCLALGATRLPMWTERRGCFSRPFAATAS